MRTFAPSCGNQISDLVSSTRGLIITHVGRFRCNCYTSNSGSQCHHCCSHGIGGQGEEWLTLIGPGLRDCFPWVKWILPNAPLRPITVHGGEVMRAWYDLSTFDVESDSTHDESGMFQTVRYLDNIIQQEVDIGIPPSRTVLMGFSQGAGMVLLTALTGRGTRGQSKDDDWKLAGVVPLSGRVPLRSKFKSLASPYVSETPIFWAHGEEDAVVKYQYGLTCAEMLVNEMAVPKLERRELGSPGLCFVTYSGLGHSVNGAELDDLKDFLEKVIPAF